MKEKQKKISVELVSLDKTSVKVPSEYVDGWGRESQRITVSGEIAQIEVRKGDKAQFGIRILEDGSIILTSYDSMFSQDVDRNLRLKNEQPWK